MLMSDTRRYAVGPDPRSRSRSHEGQKAKMADFKVLSPPRWYTVCM